MNWNSIAGARATAIYNNFEISCYDPQDQVVAYWPPIA